MSEDERKGRNPTASAPAIDDAAPRGVFSRLADVGSVAQASIPGLYAWAVTVAPVAWGRGGSVASRTAAILGTMSLALAVGLEGLGRLRAARLLSVWGLVATSSVVWALGQSFAPSRMDSARGISGMLAWGLFAYACAAPTFRRSPAAVEFDVDDAHDLRARGPSPRGDRYYVGGAAAAAIGLQLVGWVPATAERALFVRLVTIAAAVGIITVTAQVTLARHKRGRPVAAKSRRRAVAMALGAVLLVAIAGAVMLLLR